MFLLKEAMKLNFLDGAIPPCRVGFVRKRRGLGGCHSNMACGSINKNGSACV